MNWTKEQAKAIELRNKNILVAAAAGSGKTAVLVERIKRLILEDKCSIDRMLIVTFTNAAASEMKEKIHRAINQAISEVGESGDKHDLIFLKKQLDMLPMANISTFHSFALEVIHRYFYLIDIEPNFKICDDSQQTILKGQAIDQLIEEYFEEGSSRFYDFLNKFSGDRNDRKLREMIEKAFDTIQSLPEPYMWLDEAVDSLNVSFKQFMDSAVINYIYRDLSESLDRAVKKLEENLQWTLVNCFEGAHELAVQDMSIAENLCNVCKSGDFNRIKEALDNFKMPIMSKKYFAPDKNSGDQTVLAEAKAFMEKNRNLMKDCVSSAKKAYFYDTAENLYEEVRQTYEDGRYLAMLIKDFRDIYNEKKKEKGLVDFNDIEHYAYQILKDEEAAGFYREKFKHIFIDEYQDSNVIQETLISTIKRENNLFMVGDVKQSIYKFRLAEPDIFQGRYQEYAQEMKTKGEAALSEKIDLNRNFRSKKPVIDFINTIFQRIMKGYDENAALYLGDPNGEMSDYIPKLFLASSPWDEESQPDEELKTLMKAEKEALAAVKIIRDCLGKPFFDSKQGRMRPLEKKDIVILMRGVKNYANMFYKILTENNLPAYVDDNDGFFDTIEINTFMSMLAIIDNEKQDIPLLTVMRSEILAYTIDQLVEIRLGKREGSFYHALAEYAQAGENIDLRIKCQNTFDKLKEWQQMSRILPLDELVWELMLSTDFYVAMGALPSGSQRQANLRALVEKAAGYSSAGDGSLYGFMKYIDAVKEKKVAMGQVKMVGEDDDTIRIMTIHKSKGLEFPMVLLSGFCRKLNYTTLGKGAAIHKDFGIGLPVVNYNESWYKTTIIQNVIRQKYHKEEVEEEKRVLYVALTRAKDILAILGICDDVPKEVQKVMDEFPKDYSYLTMTGKVICSHKEGYGEIFNSDLVGISKGRKRAASRALKIIDEQPGMVSRPVLERLTFAYPYEKELSIKSKYSVSELAASDADVKMAARGGEQGEEESTISLVEPASFKVRQGFTAAQIGTITHKVLEKMDFACAVSEGADYIAELLRKIVAEEFITDEEAKVVNVERLADFAASPLGKRIGASPAVYREKPFNLIREIDGSSTMVQGIIDCFFEEDGMWVLVDYKTTAIKSKEEFNRRKGQIAHRYKMQLEIYREALEESTGKKVKEANLYLTNIGETIRI